MITNPLKSVDTEAMINACQNLGSIFNFEKNQLIISSTQKKFFETPSLIDVKNSGITLRFLTALAALSKSPITFTGDPSVHRRPMTPLLKSLMDAGAKITANVSSNSLFSISHLNTHKKIDFSVDGSDSQFVSALLIMLPLRKQISTISVSNPGELPWVKLTLDWLKRLGIQLTANNSLTHFSVPGNQSYRPFSYSVPGDFSSASFLLGATLLAGRKTGAVTIHNLNFNDLQGDKELFHLLKSLGADITFNNNSVVTSSKNSWQGFSVDANLFIDAVPILAVLALSAQTPSRIYNAKIAKTKECDRLVCTTKELKKMGAKITILNDDELIIHPSQLKGAQVHSHNDHRLAMALTTAALRAKGTTVIHQTECIGKSFPNFLESLCKMHADIHEEIE